MHSLAPAIRRYLKNKGDPLNATETTRLGYEHAAMAMHEHQRVIGSGSVGPVRAMSKEHLVGNIKETLESLLVPIPGNEVAVKVYVMAPGTYDPHVIVAQSIGKHENLVYTPLFADHPKDKSCSWNQRFNRVVYSEYCAGGSLKEWLAAMPEPSFEIRRGIYCRMNDLEVTKAQINIARGICLGVAALHDERIMHGNLRGSNVFLRTSYTPALASPTGFQNVVVGGFAYAHVVGDDMSKNEFLGRNHLNEWAPETLETHATKKHDEPLRATLENDIYMLAYLLSSIFFGSNHKQYYDVITSLARNMYWGVRAVVPEIKKEPVLLRENKLKNAINSLPLPREPCEQLLELLTSMFDTRSERRPTIYKVLATLEELYSTADSVLTEISAAIHSLSESHDRVVRGESPAASASAPAARPARAASPPAAASPVRAPAAAAAASPARTASPPAAAAAAAPAAALELPSEIAQILREARRGVKREREPDSGSSSADAEIEHILIDTVEYGPVLVIKRARR